MVGRIKVGAWLTFSASQRFAGHEFVWRARAGWGLVRPLHVVDRYSGGQGSTEGRLFGHSSFLQPGDENITRATAAHSAAESIWVPASLLPQRGVIWRVVGEDHIVATMSLPPERPELHLRIDVVGRVKSVCVERWGNVGQPNYGYIPFGGEISAERRFGDVVIPSRVTVGWGFGTPRFAPFSKATILEARPAC